MQLDDLKQYPDIHQVVTHFLETTTLSPGPQQEEAIRLAELIAKSYTPLLQGIITESRSIASRIGAVTRQVLGVIGENSELTSVMHTLEHHASHGTGVVLSRDLEKQYHVHPDTGPSGEGPTLLDAVKDVQEQEGEALNDTDTNSNN